MKNETHIQALIQAFVQALYEAVSDGSSGTPVPATNVNTPKTTIGGSFTSILAKIVGLVRCHKTNIPNLQQALKNAHEGCRGADLHRNVASPFYVSQTVRKWIENVGGYAKFCALAQELYGQSTPSVPMPTKRREPYTAPKTQIGVPTLMGGSDYVNMCNTYFWSRQEAGTGFVTPMHMIGIGTYEGKQCAIVKKGETDVLYAVGDLFSTGVKACKKTSVVAGIVNDTTYKPVKPQAVFVPTR